MDAIQELKQAIQDRDDADRRIRAAAAKLTPEKEPAAPGKAPKVKAPAIKASATPEPKAKPGRKAGQVPVAQQLRAALQSAAGPVSTARLIKAARSNPATVNKALKRLADQGLATNPKKGAWEATAKLRAEGTSPDDGEPAAGDAVAAPVHAPATEANGVVQ